jgi:hypothetical protein
MISGSIVKYSPISTTVIASLRGRSHPKYRGQPAAESRWPR